MRGTATVVLVAGLLWARGLGAQETRDLDLGDAVMPSEGDGASAADRVQDYIPPSAIDELPITERPAPKADSKDFQPFLWERFRALHGKGDYTRACEDLDQLRGIGDDLSAGREAAGRSYLECARLRAEQHDAAKAEALLARSEQLIGQVPERRRVLGTLARQRSDAALAKGDVDGAMAAFEQALELEPDATDRLAFSSRLAYLARAAYVRDDLDTTQKTMTAALRYFPDNKEARQLERELWLRSNLGWMVGAALLALVLIVAAGLLWRRAAAARYAAIDLDKVPDPIDDDEDGLRA